MSKNTDSAARNTSAPNKDAILEQALKLAPFDGWNQSMLYEAVKAAGLPRGAGALYFPEGPLELIGYWSKALDTEAQAIMTARSMDDVKIRDRITRGITARLNVIGEHGEAARRASARLMLPDGAAQGAAQLWASADMIWRAIGDTSTDANFYTKRATLSAVIAAVSPVWLSDESDNKTAGRAFLDARINNVMQFEKFKWDMKARTKDWPNPARVLGELRYASESPFRKPTFGKSPFKRRRRRTSRTL